MNSDDAYTKKSTALAAALEELFRQYPLAKPYEKSRRWRGMALQRALSGNISPAIIWARSTGVPDDVLYALKALLDG